MKLIKLRVIEEITGRKVGSIVLDVDSIESIIDFDNPMHKGSEITMKPVVNGFIGDDDLIYKMQNRHWVSESVEEIDALIKTDLSLNNEIKDAELVSKVASAFAQTETESEFIYFLRNDISEKMVASLLWLSMKKLNDHLSDLYSISLEMKCSKAERNGK